jgi:hypothetical protein
MSICKHCNHVGRHHFSCTASRRERGFQMIEPTPTHRIELAAGLTVYVPIRPRA